MFTYGMIINMVMQLILSAFMIVRGIIRRFKKTRLIFIPMEVVANISDEDLPKYVKTTMVAEIVAGFLCMGLAISTNMSLAYNNSALLCVSSIVLLILMFSVAIFSLYNEKKYMKFIRRKILIMYSIVWPVLSGAIIYVCFFVGL